MREELGIEIEVDEPLVVVWHTYTHFRITLHALFCRLVAGEPRCLDCAAFRWLALAELDALAMSVADRKIAQALQAWQPWANCSICASCLGLGRMKGRTARMRAHASSGVRPVLTR